MKIQTNSKRRKKTMIALGIVMIIIGAIFIYWNISYSPFKTAFIKEMEDRVSNTADTTEKCTKEDINTLPEPLQRYCNYIGIEGFSKYQVARVKFNNTRFVFNEENNTILDMDYDLWLFYDEPFRSAFCKSTMFGVPFDGIDYCTDDLEGGMKGYVAKAIKIFDKHPAFS